MAVTLTVFLQNYTSGREADWCNQYLRSRADTLVFVPGLCEAWVWLWVARYAKVNCKRRLCTHGHEYRRVRNSFGKQILVSIRYHDRTLQNLKETRPRSRPFHFGFLAPTNSPSHRCFFHCFIVEREAETAQLTRIPREPSCECASLRR